MYLNEIKDYPVLTKEEEIELLGLAKNGDIEARNRLILCNLRLVVFIAKNYLNTGVSFLDLIEEGNLGLYKAIENFDFNKGTRFSTYAATWINQKISYFINYKTKVIRTSVYTKEKIIKIKKFEERFEKLNGRKPSKEEIIDNLGISSLGLKDIEKVNLVLSPVSLDNISNEEECSVLKFIADEEAEAEYERIIDNIYKKQVIDLIKESKAISNRERKMLFERYGIEDNIPKTLQEVGDLNGLSRERTRQIIKRALIKLKYMLIDDNTKRPRIIKI